MSILDTIAEQLRLHAAQADFSDEDIKLLSTEIFERIKQQADINVLPDSVVTSALKPTIQIMLARDHASITNAAQHAVNVLLNQVAEDPFITIPKQFRSGEFCPYPGLKAFTQENSSFFFGRDAEVNDLCDNLDHTLIAITGPSGVGKSSFVHAGILPRIKLIYGENAICLIYRISATSNLLNEFAFFLHLATGLSTEDILRKFEDRNDALLEVIQTLRSKSDRVVLVLDQFEELFTSDEVSHQRRRLLDNLVAIKNKQTSPCFVTFILTARKNFLEHPDYTTRHTLVNAIEHEDIHLQSLDDQQLHEAIEKPINSFNSLHSQSIEFQQGLTDLIVREFRRTSVSLPIVQYMLRLMWIEKHHLSHFAYNSLGRLDRVLDRHATEVYEQFSDSEKPIVNRILLDLVRFGLEGEHTRKRIQREYLFRLADEVRQVQQVLQRLSDERTRIISEQRIGKITYVELTHEVILREWALLHSLVETHKERIIIRDQLLVIADLWSFSRTDKQPLGDPSYLYRSATLRLAQQYISDERYHGGTDNRILACLDASRKWQRKRFYQILGIAAVALVVIGIAALTMQKQITDERQRADANATAQILAEQKAVESAKAEETAQAQKLIEQQAKQQQADLALSRELAASARSMLEDKFDLALLLSVASYRVAETYEAKSSLLAGLQYSPNLTTFLHSPFVSLGEIIYGFPYSSIIFSPDGKLLTYGEKDGTVILRDTVSYEVVGIIPTDRANIGHNLAFSPDSKILASFASNGIALWDVESQQPIGPPFTGNHSPVNSVDFSSSGEVLVSGGGELYYSREQGEIILWDVATHEIIDSLVTNFRNSVTDVEISPDDKLLASSLDDGSGEQTTILWDMNTHQMLGEPFGNYTAAQVLDIEFSPKGNILATGSRQHGPASEGGEIILWDTSTLQQVSEPITSKTVLVNSLSFSPSGEVLIANGGFGSKDVVVSSLGLIEQQSKYDVYIQQLKGHSKEVMGVDFSPKGNVFASIDNSGTIGIWDLSRQSLLSKELKLGDDLYGIAEMDGDNFVSVGFSVDGQLLLAVDSSGEIFTWNIKTGERINSGDLPYMQEPQSEVTSTDGKIKMVAGEVVELWDVSTNQVLVTLNARAGSVAMSPDGKLAISYGFPSHAWMSHPPFLWNLDINSWLTLACKIANRDLSDLEWEQYIPERRRFDVCDSQ